MKEKISQLEEQLESAVNNEEFSKLQQENMQVKEDHETLQREHKLIVTAMYNMGLELFKYRSGHLDVNSLLSNSHNSLKTSQNTIAAPLASSACASIDDSMCELNQTTLTLSDITEESPKAPVISMPPPTVTKPSLQSVSKVANSVRKPLQTLKHNEVANTPRVPVRSAKSTAVPPMTTKRLTLAERALQVRNGGVTAVPSTSAAVGTKRKLEDDIDLVPSSSVKRQRVTMK